MTYGEALKGTLVGSKRGAGGNTSLEGPETRLMRKSGGETID